MIKTLLDSGWLLIIGMICMIAFFYWMCKYHIGAMVIGFLLLMAVGGCATLVRDAAFLENWPGILRIAAAALLNLLICGFALLLVYLLFAGFSGGGSTSRKSLDVSGGGDNLSDSSFHEAYRSLSGDGEAYVINAYDRYAVLRDRYSGKAFNVYPHRDDMLIDDDGNLWVPD